MAHPLPVAYALPLTGPSNAPVAPARPLSLVQAIPLQHKKSPAKKSPAKKSPAKKSPAKKSPAKKIQTFEPLIFDIDDD